MLSRGEGPWCQTMQRQSLPSVAESSMRQCLEAWDDQRLMPRSMPWWISPVQCPPTRADM